MTEEPEQKPCTDSTSITAINNFARGGVQTRRSNVQTMVQSGDVLKFESKPRSYSNIGWKWAQCDDAEWMLNDFIHSERKIFGLTKEQLGGDNDGNGNDFA